MSSEADPWGEFRARPADADPWAEFRQRPGAGAAAPTAPAGPRPSALDAAGQGLARGMTFGHTAEIAGLEGGIGGLFTGEGFSAGYQRERDRVREYERGVDAAHPVVASAAEGAGAAATMMVPFGALARAPGVIGRAGAALSSQPVAQMAAGAGSGAVTEATGDPLLGLAAGLATPLATGALGRVVTPIRSRLAPEVQGLADAAEREGIRLTPAQATGSPALRTLEEGLAASPVTAGAMAGARDVQGVQFNRAVLARSGTTADRATDAVLRAAETRIGDEFTRHLAGQTIPLDPQALRELRGVVAEYGRRLPTNTRPVFQSYVGDLLAAQGGMDGATYQTTRSALSRQAEGFAEHDPGLASALRGLRDALDGAADRALPAANADGLREARRQYGSLRDTARAMNGEGRGTGAGNVVPTRLRAAITAGDPEGYAMGRGELSELARIGQTVLRDQPGEASRWRGYGGSALLGLPGVPAGGVAHFLGAGPAASVALGVGSAAAVPLVVRPAYQSRPGQAYLRNRLLPDVVEPVTGALGPGVAPATTAAMLYGRSALLPPETAR